MVEFVAVAQEERLATFLIGYGASSAARDSSEVVLEYSQRCYTLTGNNWCSWCASSSLSLSVGFSTKDDAMGVVQPAPQGVHYQEDVIHLYP